MNNAFRPAKPALWPVLIAWCILLILCMDGCAGKKPPETQPPAASPHAAPGLSSAQTDIDKEISSGNLEKVKTLVKRDPGLLTGRDFMGYTPLHMAVADNKKEIVRFLISKGADVNATDAQGSVPLHYAASEGNKDIMDLLLEKGAQIEAKNKLNLTPLHMAVMQNKKDTAGLLLKKGAKADAKGGFGGETPLYYAVLKGNRDMVLFLLSKGAKVNAAQEMTGQTPLFIAVSAKKKDMVELLIAKGADVNSKDRMGLRPLDAASALGARKEGQLTMCRSNLMNIGTGLEMYSSDHEGRFPRELREITPDYLKAIPCCPSAGKDTYSQLYSSSTNPDYYQVCCAGENHRGAGVAKDYPRYVAAKGIDMGPREKPSMTAEEKSGTEIAIILKKHGAKKGELTFLTGKGGLPPQFSAMREMGQATGCKSNLKNIGTALEMYSTDNEGRYPRSIKEVTPNYLRQLPTCPAAKKDTYSSTYRVKTKPDEYLLFCKGEYHRKAGSKKDHPQYSSKEGLIE
ncbi:MAG: ankyrin repeat domain-containing protein [Candidatus Eremiobacteraeota bacterium]|nr:ankyrin repeat domain-containing protein [Candidatus Eremiobacteraeota bacterium]